VRIFALTKRSFSLMLYCSFFSCVPHRFITLLITCPFVLILMRECIVHSCTAHAVYNMSGAYSVFQIYCTNHLAWKKIKKFIISIPTCLCRKRQLLGTFVFRFIVKSIKSRERVPNNSSDVLLQLSVVFYFFLVFLLPNCYLSRGPGGVNSISAIKNVMLF